MAIRPFKIASLPDGSDTTRILPSEMNPLTAPAGAPQHGDFWCEFAGTSPTRTLTIWIYDSVVAAWKSATTITY